MTVYLPPPHPHQKITKTPAPQPPAPWIPNEISEALKVRNKAQKILKSDRLNATLQNLYKNLKSRIKELIHNSKKEYYHSQLSSS